MSEKILTAEEIILNKYNVESLEDIAIYGNKVVQFMQEFAKIHVKVALETANNANLGELGKCYDCGGAHIVDELKLILNSYPLENIK